MPKSLKLPSISLFFLAIVLSWNWLFCFEYHPKHSSPSILYNKPSQPILEIDTQSVKTADEIGGGVYYREVDAIVPFFPSLVRDEWLSYKNAIAERIGLILPAPSKESALWKNSATTLDQLILDANRAAPYFWEMCLNVAHKTGGVANFGIDNHHMIKSKRSINLKIEESMRDGLSREEAVTKIRDALRGTIIAETPEQIPLIVQTLKEVAAEMGREFVFINIWNESRPSGYVGIHAKMLYPIYDAKGNDTQRNIIIEIQIHLRCIMDGTSTCVKEREHSLYEQMRMRGIDPAIQTSASTLLYLTALKQCPKKPHTKLRHN